MRPAVLCADDDRNLCQILAKALRGEGYEVLLAHDGDEALEHVQSHQPDLVLLDLLLPKRDGFGVLEAIRGQEGGLSNIPVLLFTGCSRTPSYLERARKLRAAAFLTKPVPLDELLDSVGKHLPGRPSKPVPQRAAGHYQQTRPAPVCGQLDELPFPALLHHLHGMRASGLLHLRHARKHKRLQLRDGRPIAVRSNLVNECLGNLLVRTGRIGQKELGESVRRMRQGEGLQGEILVAMQRLSEEELPAVLRLQAEEKLFEIFEWEAGRFELALGARLERGNSLALSRSPADVILAGVRGRFPLHRIDAFLTENGDRLAVPGESPFYRFQEIALQPEEQHLLHETPSPIPVSSLLAKPEAFRRSAYGLLVTGLLETVEAVEASRSKPRAGAVARATPQPSATSELSSRSRGRAPGTSRSSGVAQDADCSDPDPADRIVRTELAALVERSRGASYFAVLGLGTTPSDEEVRQAYADLAKRTHPDRFPHSSAAVRSLAEQAFAIVARAYEGLSDATRRAAYRLDRRKQEAEAAELEEGHRALRAELEFQKGERRLRSRDYQGALESFQWALDLYPEEGEYHAYAGWASYLARGKTPEARKEALRHLRRAAKLAPDREKPYLFLGRLYREAGRADVAERAFARALQLQPDCVEALRELRLIEMRRQKTKGLIARIFRRSGQAEAKRWPREARPG